MKRHVRTYDLDIPDTDDAHTIYACVIGCMPDHVPYAMTKTPNGIHLHVSSRYANDIEQCLFENNIIQFVDKTGTDVCSPIPGTFKDGVLITKKSFNDFDAWYANEIK